MIKANSSQLLLLVVLIAYLSCRVAALECYTGYSMLKGRPVGTSREVCKKSSDQCYKASVELNTLTKLKLAGCSTLRCKASSNRCTSQNIAGQHYELCCCDTDLCNTRQQLQANNQGSTGVVGGVMNRLKDAVQGRQRD